MVVPGGEISTFMSRNHACEVFRIPPGRVQSTFD